MDGTTRPPPRGSRAATTIAVALLGAGLGLLAGWGFAEWKMANEFVDSKTAVFVSSLLIAGLAGGVVGALVGSLLGKRHPVVGVRALLRGTAVAVALSGLAFALFLNQPCTKLEPVPGSTIAFTCTESNHLVALRLAIASGAALVAVLLIALAARRPDA